MRSSQTCVKKDGCEMYNLIEQNVSEARTGLTQTLWRMAGGEKIVLIASKLAPSYRDLETRRGSVASVNLGEPDSDET